MSEETAKQSFEQIVHDRFKGNSHHAYMALILGHEPWTVEERQELLPAVPMPVRNFHLLLELYLMFAPLKPVWDKQAEMFVEMVKQQEQGPSGIVVPR